MKTSWVRMVALTAMVLLPQLGAAQTVAPVAVNPATAPAGVGTAVTVTAVITDPSVIATGVLLQRLDAAGRVIATLGTLLDNGTGGDATAGDRTFSLRTSIYEVSPGPVTLRVSAAFAGRLTRVLSAPMTVQVTGTSTALSITMPGNLEFLNVTPTRVTGTIGDPAAQVVINGVEATVASGTFTALVPVLEGTNTVTAVATNANGSTTTASVQVTLDTTPPRITINTPDADFSTSDAAIAVGGVVNDIVVGTVNPLQATVTVNGLSAQVLNRSFFLPALPLALGSNTIQAVATDRSGNSTTASVTVNRVLSTAGAISVVSGHNQTGATGATLPQPLVARVLNAAGQPVIGVPVVFKVVENSGGLVSGTAALGSLAVMTNAAGQASATFQLGSRSGVGNNVVEATATGFDGTAVFAHSGTATGARRIVVDTGNGQTGVTGQRLPLPFVAIVTDEGHNRLGGVPITFSVRQGGGSINGLTSLATTSDSDGRVAAVLTLGRQEGFDNNVVEATFAGNPGQPAAFLASAKVPADPAATRISGVVLNNSNKPIAGVTMRLFRTHHGTGVAEQVVPAVQTDASGNFVIHPAPIGTFKLMADGSTAPQGPWPTLEFDLVTIAGQNNDVGLPIYLPELDTVNRLCVSETTGGTLTLPQVPGFSLAVAAGSATFPGGARAGCVSVTPVNGDKVPMAPGFGQQPRFVVTIQPVGTVFNPPARITLPNVDGLAPRQVTEMYSYDHDLAAFVSIGTGTVSEDGSLIASDPGVGVIKAGWHCGGNPNPVGSAATCPDCHRCQGSQCIVDNSLTPEQDSPNDCKEQRCSSGSVVSVNRDSEVPGNVCQRCSSGAPISRDNGNAFLTDGSVSPDQCCFDGASLAKYGQTINRIGFDGGPLDTQCPDRQQVQGTGGQNGNGLHFVDGCSGGVPPFHDPQNRQNPMEALYGTSLLAVGGAPATRFGQILDEISSSSAAGPLPCNRHDICYQTCSPGSGATVTSGARASCDANMLVGMRNVCDAAYPSSCPYSSTALCAAYFIQYASCLEFAGLYWEGLVAAEAFVGAYQERQQQYCKCCQ